MLAIADDHPGAGAEDRPAGRGMGADRRLEPVALDRLRDRRRLATRNHEPVELAELARACAPRPRRRRATRSIRAWAAKSPWLASTPIRSAAPLRSGGAMPRGHAQPRGAGAARPRRRAGRCRRRASARRARSRPRRLARDRRSGSSPRRSRGPAAPGSEDLKIPEPTKLPSAPSCIVSAASAGVAIPPAQNSGTGSQPLAGDLLDDLDRRAAAPWPRRRAARGAACRAA